MDRPNCTDCKIAWAVTDENPPCYKCFPGVHKYNVDAFKAHSHVQGQYVMSMSGAVALNVMAIHKTLDCFGLPYNEERLDIIYKIQAISSSLIDTQHQDQRKRQKK